MSSSDVPLKTRLKIRPGVPDAHTTVFDAWDQVVHEDFGRETQVDLPRGLYTLRVERGGLLEETLVRHAGEQAVEPKVPGRYTSALIAGATTSHEYFTDPAVRFSTELTCPDLDGGNQSGLFIFIRTSNDRFSGEQDVSAGLSLVTPNGQTLPLDADLARRDTDRGWMAFSAKGEPGTCYLRYDGEEPRTVPIHLSHGWQTQVFLTYRDRPLFDGMRVFQAGLSDGFQPSDETTDAVDRALTDLQSGTRSIRRKEMNHLLGGKFANPMLGLLAAHLLLRREEPNRGLLNVVVYNLNNLAGDSPDFAALCLRINRRFPDENLAPLPPPTIDAPPMIRDGFEAVVEAAADDLDLIPRYSPMERAVTGLLHDSPWTSWRDEGLIVRGVTRGFFGVAPSPGPSPDPAPPPEEFDWVETAVLDHLESRASSELRVNPVALARAIGVSQAAVLGALGSLRTRSAASIEREWPGLGSAIRQTPDLLERAGGLDLQDLFGRRLLHEEGESPA